MDDEKTLKIKVVHGADDDQRPPAKPIVPPSPSAPPSPQAPAGQRPTSPTVFTGSLPPVNKTSAAPNVVTLPATPPVVTAPQIPNRPTAPPIVGSGGASPPTVPPVNQSAVVAGNAMIVVGAVLTGLGTVTAATAIVSAAFTRLASTLKEYNSNLAQASAISEVRQIQGDIRQSQELSRELSQFLNNRTNIDLSMQRLETAVVKLIAPTTDVVMKDLQELLKWAEIVAALFGKLEAGGFFAEMIKILVPPLGVLLALKPTSDRLAEWLGIQLNDPAADASSFQKDIMDALNPRRAEFKPAVNAFEAGKTPKRVIL